MTDRIRSFVDEITVRNYKACKLGPDGRPQSLGSWGMGIGEQGLHRPWSALQQPKEGPIAGLGLSGSVVLRRRRLSDGTTGTVPALLMQQPGHARRRKRLRGRTGTQTGNASFQNGDTGPVPASPSQSQPIGATLTSPLRRVWLLLNLNHKLDPGLFRSWKYSVR